MMLIGKLVCVKSTNKNLDGLCGKIINETKYSLTLEVKGEEKIILKNQVVKLLLDNEEISAELLKINFEERNKNEEHRN